MNRKPFAPCPDPPSKAASQILWPNVRENGFINTGLEKFNLRAKSALGKHTGSTRIIPLEDR